MKKRIQFFDSLRLFAFFLVVIYHLFPKWLGAGFLGVNLFFALSGFLITGGLLDQWKDQGKISFLDFLKKRGRRLLPGLFLLVLFSSFLLLFSTKDLRVDYGRQLAAALGFTTNLYEIVSGGSYEAKFVPHLYVHTWTLAMEMHFYLVWGGLFYLLGRFFRSTSNDRLQRTEPKRKPQKQLDSSTSAFVARSILPKDRNPAWEGEGQEKQETKTRSQRETSRPLEQGRQKLETSLLLLSLLGFLLPQLLLILGKALGWSTALLYFSNASRMAPFFAGSLLAILLGKRPTKLAKKLAKGLSSLALTLGMLASLALVLFLSRKLSYQASATYFFGFFLTDLACLLALFSARILDAKDLSIQEAKWIHQLAGASYAFYLFHWPIHAVLSTTGLGLGLQALFTLVLASIMTYFYQRLWEPLLVGERVQLFSKIPALTRIFAAFVLLGCLLALFQVWTAPKLLSLEENLWASALGQDLDLVQEEVDQVKKQAAQDQERIALEAQTKEEGFTLLGDSIALGMRGYIKEVYPTAVVDGKVSRFLHQAQPVLDQLASQGRLKKLVIIALGNNVYPSFAQDAEALVAKLAVGSRLIFLSPYDQKESGDSDIENYAAFLPSLEEKYPFVTVANWNQVSKDHPEIYQGTDGVHFYAKEAGIPLYLETLQDAVLRAYQKPAKD